MVVSSATEKYNQARRDSQSKAILGNLRQIASGADQYFLEHNTTSANLDQIITEYIKHFSPVLGEAYPQTIRQGDDICAKIPDADEFRDSVICIAF
ncbi:MAG TPA: hypothetical protein VJ952_10390 [Opitutales bacterium]|nr:hypothetical protein [Opitutales bacterium]